jgi:hypothetical protein
VKSVATRRFWSLFLALPQDVQQTAIKNYHLWRVTRRSTFTG